jgi:hypothetical protein
MEKERHYQLLSTKLGGLDWQLNHLTLIDPKNKDQNKKGWYPYPNAFELPTKVVNRSEHRGANSSKAKEKLKRSSPNATHCSCEKIPGSVTSTLVKV